MILILFLGETKFDSRSQKFIEAVKSAGNNFIILELNQKPNRFIFSFLSFGFQFLKTILKHKITMVIAMDVFTVPFAAFLKFTQSIPFHFDARELNAKVFAFRKSRFKSSFWGFFEWLGFSFAETVTTVNESLQISFERLYHKKSIVIYNYPHISVNAKHDLIREKFNLNKTDFLWVFQGGLQPGRGIDFAVEFIKNRPKHEKLIFIGENKMNISFQSIDPDKIFYTGIIANNDLLKWTSSGDAGLIFIDDSAESYRLSLPNKFFEYIFAEIPVLSFNLPEMANFIHRFNCGVISNRQQISENADPARIPLHQAYALTDREGRSVQDELRAIGFLGDTDPILSPPYAYLECHIEQGPVLRKSGMDIGVVQGVQAISWQKLTLIGRSAHAGTTPMELRADASVVASRINLHMRDMTRSGRFGTELRATMGGMFPQPGLVNVIPGHMVVTVDLRHPDNQTLHAAEQELRTFCEHAAQQEGVSVSFLQTAKTDSVAFDEGLKQRIEQAASRRNLSFQRIISGAGHDAQELARLTRAAMVFVPGEFDGISHNPREYSTEKQCADGVNVLLDVLLSLADET